MIVYKYDEKTGVYASNVQAQESPREPGVYLIPAMATDVMPPATGKNECPVWENGKWTVKPNFRGTKYWLHDGSEHSITEINVVPPADALFEKPIIPPTFEEAKAAKLAEINAACDSILNAATATYPASEVLTFDQQTAEAKAYHADNAASVPLLSALAASRNMLLPELVHRVLAKHDAFSALSGAVIGQRQALEDTLDSLTTVEFVQALEVNIQIPGATV